MVRIWLLTKEDTWLDPMETSKWVTHVYTSYITCIFEKEIKYSSGCHINRMRFFSKRGEGGQTQGFFWQREHARNFISLAEREEFFLERTCTREFFERSKHKSKILPREIHTRGIFLGRDPHTRAICFYRGHAQEFFGEQQRTSNTNWADQESIFPTQYRLVFGFRYNISFFSLDF